MNSARRILASLLLLSTAVAARADEPLVPKGEGVDLVDGAQWASFIGPRALVASADGAVFATASEDGVLRLWDAASGRETRRFPGTSSQPVLAISADGKVVAVGGRDGSVQVWDAGTGKSLAHRDGDNVPVVALALQPDGKALVFGSVRRGPSYWAFSDSADPVAWSDVADTRGLVFAPKDPKKPAAGGWQVAVSRGDHTVVIVDVTAHKILKTFGAPAGVLGPVAFNAGGARLAAGGENGQLTEWDVVTGKAKTIEAHSQAVNALVFSSGGTLLTAATDGAVRVWDAETLQLIRKNTSDQPCCTGLGLAPSSTILTLTPTHVARWDLASGTSLSPVRGQIAAVGAVATSGISLHTMALASADGAVRVVSGETGQLVTTLGGGADQVVAVSADEKLLAYADHEHAVHVYSFADSKDLNVLPPLDSAPTTLAFSPDAKMLAVANGTTSVKTWDIEKNEKAFDLTATNPVSALGYASNGLVLVTGEGAVAVVRAAATGVEQKRISLGGAPAAPAAPSGGLIPAIPGAPVIPGLPGVPGAPPIPGVAEAPKPERHGGGPAANIISISVSEDGKKIAVGLADGSARVLDASGSESNRIPAARAPGTPVWVGLTHDARTLVTAGKEGIVRFWNLPSGREAGQVEDQSGGDSSVAVSVDDTAVLVGGTDGAMRVWDLKDHTPRGLFRSGPSGWLWVTKDRLVRGDTGGFLLHSNDSGALVAVPPKPSSTSPDLAAEAVRGGVVAPGQGPATGKITLHITNGAQAGPAYWITAESAKLPPGLQLVDPPVIPRIDPGGDATLVVPVSFMSPGAPAPQDAKIELRVAHAYGFGPTVAVQVHMKSPKVEAQLVAIDGSSAAPVVRLQITNTGDEDTGPLTITPAFMEKGAVLATQPVIEMPSLAKGQGAQLAIAGPPKSVRKGVSLNLIVRGTLWPTFQWTSNIDMRTSWPWASITLALFFCLVVGIVVYGVRISRHPIVVQIQQDASSLRQYDLAALKSVQGALVRARRLNDALTTAKLPEARWKRAVLAASSEEGAVTAFIEAIGGKRTEQPIAGQTAWAVELPELQLRFPKRTAVAVVTGAQAEAGPATGLAGALHADGEGPSVAIALDMTDEQNAVAVLQAVPRMSFVVLSRAELRDLLYDDHPLTMLQKIIATQRPLAELSPYQSTAGVEDEGLFYGREKELRAIADRVLHNFLVVAPRQMGKSSLLKAVHRRLSARQDVEVHLITLFEDDLAARVARQLNRPKPESSENFLEIAAGTRRKPRVWLVDEADRYIVRDARGGYPISQAMRTLSEEGRAYFILAGFWHLYAAAYLNANNPLRNFGELLRLEPLDRAAAGDLARKPMELMGITYEDPALVEQILDETACRAHLVTAVCRGIIDGLGPEEKRITAAAVETALYQNPLLADEFKYWRREPLGRALVRLTLIEGPATRGELRERLIQRGLSPANEIFQSTVDRLDLGYLLVQNAAGQLECPVPLLRRFVELEDDLEAGLQHDIDEFLGHQPVTAGVTAPAA